MFKDLSGRLGPSAAALLASQSSLHLQSVTVVLKDHWMYNVLQMEYIPSVVMSMLHQVHENTVNTQKAWKY